MSAPIMILTGVLGLEGLSLYKTAKSSSLIAGKIFSAKGFAQDLSRNFLSLSVSDKTLSSNDIRVQSFLTKDIVNYLPIYL